jgi:hypothetical protein
LKNAIFLWEKGKKGNEIWQKAKKTTKHFDFENRGFKILIYP